MVIYQVLPEDRNGGAERIPEYLHREFIKNGFESFMLVGEKHSNESYIFQIPNFESRTTWARKILTLERKISNHLTFRGGWRIRELIRFIAEPKRMLRVWLGYEDFEFPGTWKIFDIAPKKPDIILCHVLHGFWLYDRGFFDLRALPFISQRAKLFLTLHDMWLFTGHCSHSIGCERWKIGCGKCPDLLLPPRIRRDLSHKIWKIKRDIYRKSRYYVICPSHWMKDLAEKSILKEGAIEIRVIHNGIDLEIFSPQDREKKRTELELPKNSKIFLTAGKSLKTNRWKGFSDFIALAKILSDEFENLVFVGLGASHTKEVEKIGKKEGNFIFYLPFEQNHTRVRDYYSASDFYVQPSSAESFSLTVLESQACGSIACGKKVGGIPEIIKDMENGILFSDIKELYEKIKKVLKEEKLYNSIREKGIENSKKFNIKEKAKEYVEFFLSVSEK
jgi:glycosyltransferase involved in cell wall biosynthesis